MVRSFTECDTPCSDGPGGVSRGPASPASRTSYVAGEIGQCDLWFPPIRLPVGFGQVRKPADPEAKGLIERCHDYLERSFLPGRAFASPADFNGQLQRWLAVVNARPRRALGCAPVERIAADRAAVLTLPPVAPVTGWRFSARLARSLRAAGFQ